MIETRFLLRSSQFQVECSSWYPTMNTVGSVVASVVALLKWEHVISYHLCLSLRPRPTTIFWNIMVRLLYQSLSYHGTSAADVFSLPTPRTPPRQSLWQFRSLSRVGIAMPLSLSFLRSMGSGTASFHHSSSSEAWRWPSLSIPPTFIKYFLHMRRLRINRYDVDYVHMESTGEYAV